MSAALEERLRVALKGASYFADEAALDLEYGDREELFCHLSLLRQIVMQALKAYKDLPAPPWPNAATREAFGRSAAEWHKATAA